MRAALGIVSLLLVGTHTGSFAASPLGVVIVGNGQPTAVIVTADQPTPVARYAAQELIAHVEKATGAKLVTLTESAAEAAVPQSNARIYIGDTRAARAAGVDAPKLAAETFSLRSDEPHHAIFIAGNDGPGDPLDRDTSAGTLFGVYEWLERNVGVRWLWPGELGTYVPRTRTLIAPAVDETISPRFFQRHVRAGLDFKSENRALGFTPRAAETYAKEQTIFLRRHRMGRGERMSYGHAFTNWWEKYGREHPE